MKAAVYSGTRNLYRDMEVSIKSILHNSDVEKIYLLLEDYDIGYDLPEECEVINISGQEWFRPGGPNYGSSWTYMVLIRAAYHRLFPDLDRILSIDVDTVVCKDISHLWDLDMDGKMIAAVRETTGLDQPEFPYFNAGMMMMNLERLRTSGRGDEVIDALNRRKFAYPEQDVFNMICSGSVLWLPREYNAGRGTEPYGNPIIRHFMGEHENWKVSECWKKYNEMPWSEVRP